MPPWKLIHVFSLCYDPLTDYLKILNVNDYVIIRLTQMTMKTEDPCLDICSMIMTAQRL